MLSLKNLSKFYYSNGMIASGLTKVNLELSMGEFVVITGESGSGKSTLINVLSGLDSYEEGEMYINGHETSHYTATDFENYRKTYIANIFQSFNLVASYTVYQNVELALLIDGKKSRDVKDRVNKLINQVGLEKYRNTKVSKLSGGQKQRVAIARALAKDTPIIVADEPTGNLDSESAKSIVELLSNISKDKLVIVVTHNYDQFEAYATRHIKLFDGRIVEDTTIKKAEGHEVSEKDRTEFITFGNKIRLGARNAFNLFTKFILTLLVFSIVLAGLFSLYEGWKVSNKTPVFEFNQYISNGNTERIITKKADNTPLTQEDYDKLSKIKGVANIIRDDDVFDTSIDEIVPPETDVRDIYPARLADFNKKLTLGRMPENDNEYVLEINQLYALSEQQLREKVLDKEGSVTVNGIYESVPAKVVGIRIHDEGYPMRYNIAYLSDNLINKLKMDQNRKKVHTHTNIVIGGKKLDIPDGGQFTLVANDNVPVGTVYMPEVANTYYDTGVARGRLVDYTVADIHNTVTKELAIRQIITEKNYKSLLGIEESFENINGTGIAFVNSQDFMELYMPKADYQYSVMVKDPDDAIDISKEINKLGYVSVSTQQAKNDDLMKQIQNIIVVPLYIIFAVGLYYIGYFIIRLILKSRGSYFATLRILGSNKKSVRQIMDMELLTIGHISFALILAIMMINKFTDLLNVTFINNFVKFTPPIDYLVLYLIMLVLALLVSRRFSRKLFVSSAMNTFRTEVAE